MKNPTYYAPIFTSFAYKINSEEPELSLFCNVQQGTSYGKIDFAGYKTFYRPSGFWKNDDGNKTFQNPILTTNSRQNW